MCKGARKRWIYRDRTRQKSATPPVGRSPNRSRSGGKIKGSTRTILKTAARAKNQIWSLVEAFSWKQKTNPRSSSAAPPTFHFPLMVLLLLAFRIFRFRCFCRCWKLQTWRPRDRKHFKCLQFHWAKCGGYEKGIKGNVWLGIDFAISFACNFDAIWIRFPWPPGAEGPSNGDITLTIIMFP